MLSIPGRAAAAPTRTAAPSRRKQCRRSRPARSFQPGLAYAETGADETFYGILGVDPTADPADIKRSYYSLVRECHPDRSMDDSSTEFCKLVNEIYEILSDPARRLVYDEMIGIAHSPVNPFLDPDAELNQVFVDEFSCIGCRNCNCLCPATFGMEEDYGRARAFHQGRDAEEDLQAAIDSCPVSCIHWVSGQQRQLLDRAMRGMGRVPVWALMSGSGANVNVFQEASTIWERQQADLRSEADAEANAAFWGGMWTGPGYDARFSAASEAAQDGASGGGASAPRGMAARVSELSVRANAAVGRWKEHQRQQRLQTPQKTLAR